MLLLQMDKKTFICKIRGPACFLKGFFPLDFSQNVFLQYSKLQLNGCFSFLMSKCKPSKGSVKGLLASLRLLKLFYRAELSLKADPM